MVERILIYPWELSATDSWSPDTGIFELRDRTAAELADKLWEYGAFVQNTAIVELITHGNPRKAAEFARALVTEHPEVKNSVMECFGQDMFDYLLNSPLENIPSSPQEYPRDVIVEYIQ